MAITTIVGSSNLGSFLANANNDALKIVGALDNVNNPNVQRQVKGRFHAPYLCK